MSGKLIVIEGLDGSGKATQTELVYKFLKENNVDVLSVTFPDYNSKSSALVQMYLNGEIGSLTDVNAFAAAGFYSMDRYISYRTSWKDAYLSGAVIIADRYTTSNICHQMAKLPKAEWEGYIDWLTEFEYKLLGIPSPDLVIYLDMHPEATKKLLTSRYQGDESKKDMHEKNTDYTLSCREAALFAANKLNWSVIPCCDDNKEPLDINEISEKIFLEVKQSRIITTIQ